MGIALILLFLLIALGLPIAAVLGWLAVLLDWLLTPFPLQRAFGEIAWSHSIEFTLIAIPMFIMMGEILLRSGIADRMYAGVSAWLGWLPGGLMHANIGASALFAATSGSSVATAATIGTTAMPQVDRHGYSERLFLGSLAAGGTLGILIPPSINMIIYGFLTDTSVPRLFMAGLVPGIVLAAIFSMTILVLCILRPSLDGDRGPPTARALLHSLSDLAPPIGLFGLVIGSIYAGWATPTEAASVGVVAALGLTALYRRLSWPMMVEVFLGTVRTSSMMILITLLAFLLNFVIGATGMAGTVNDLVRGLNWSPLATMLVILSVYLVLGMFMDTLAMIVLTIPIVTPIVVGLGYDPIWFGVMMVLIAETSVLTPPIGMLCYVVHGVRGRGELTDVFIGVTPFILALMAMIALMLATPQLALWLPNLLF
ncbi:TRAP transporter large permease subunit [Rhodovulum sulfidophilum]|uniref:TRAP transporter large permease n=1 Tax=Rhodovulum sulfidophilum TaxID=35806 RepID=UPI0019250D1C|nr:TRAP transporter large permease subunit [Rhodovulum sulfidophilum]MBL3574980.1 TRAP transporter large permease subunit [Rhodovulum sulfidophilum]MCE8432407.1 TRAP transporter large permease subunit [Rhodovulum sulfidophilum]MCF4119205.1 TRAP transporter large permease subunit [Rhodovulum sulfidophilum]